MCKYVCLICFLNSLSVFLGSHAFLSPSPPFPPAKKSDVVVIDLTASSDEEDEGDGGQKTGEEEEEEEEEGEIVRDRHNVCQVPRATE